MTSNVQKDCIGSDAGENNPANNETHLICAFNHKKKKKIIKSDKKYFAWVSPMHVSFLHC
jgi:hypothetical protein